MGAKTWLTRGCFVLFAVPFVLVGAWLVRARLATRQELRAIDRHAAVTSIGSASGPVRLVGILHAVTAVRTTGGQSAVFVRTTVRRLERGGGARVCDESAEVVALRIASGELVSLEALLDAQVDIDGTRQDRKGALPIVRVLRGALEEKPLADASSCKGPPSLAGRVAVRELALLVGQEATVFACVDGGRVKPCGDGADAIVVGADLGPLRAYVAREPEQTVFEAAVHLVLLSVLGFAALLGLPSRRLRGFAVEVVRR